LSRSTVIKGIIARKPISFSGSPEDAFRRLSYKPGFFFLDSAGPAGRFASHSFFGFSPFMQVRSRGIRVDIMLPDGRTETRFGNPWSILRELRKPYEQYALAEPTALAGGGIAGYWAYDLGRFVERVPEFAQDDLRLPELCVGFYSEILSFDHANGQWEATAIEPCDNSLPPIVERLYRLVSALQVKPVIEPPPAMQNLPPPQYKSNMDRREYERAVKKVLDYISSGDIFQANMTQRLQAPVSVSPQEFYLCLRKRNPAPFAAYLDCGDFAVCSSSPELFLRAKGSRVLTRPIKGTRPRGKTAAEDEALRNELLSSDKDRAELAMIVDLERNDMGRVCSYGSVRVTEPLVIEQYPTVHHLVATIEGEVHPRYDVIHLLRACFPGGSITGAPKVRAMEIIEELEHHRRSVYTGAIGYLGFNGCSDLNIAIRTAVVMNGQAIFGVGGGIVADSDPALEYEESLHKARGMLEAVSLANEWAQIRKGGVHE